MMRVYVSDAFVLLKNITASDQACVQRQFYVVSCMSLQWKYLAIRRPLLSAFEQQQLFLNHSIHYLGEIVGGQLHIDNGTTTG